MAKGLAITGMVMLHLFCRLGSLPYKPLIWIGSVPLVYYLGLFGDLCVPVYCFTGGYAQGLLRDKYQMAYYRTATKKIGRLLLNYWIVLFLFAGLGSVFDESGRIPGAFSDFLGNFFLYRMSYNGAWWFLLTYLILVALTPCMVYLAKHIDDMVLLVSSGVIYFVAYLFRFPLAHTWNQPVVDWIWTQAILVGTSQLSWIVGIICYQRNTIGRIREGCEKLKVPNIAFVVIPCLLIVVHGMEQSLIIAPITGLLTLLCLYLVKKPAWLENVLLFFGAHSTNIWLTHMFFYMCIFKGLVEKAKYPVLILGFMLVLCCGTSYIVQGILQGIDKCLDKLKLCA